MISAYQKLFTHLELRINLIFILIIHNTLGPLAKQSMQLYSLLVDKMTLILHCQVYD